MTVLLPIASGGQVLAYLRTADPGKALVALGWTVLAAAGTVTTPLLLGRLVDGDPVLAWLAVAVLATAICTALAQRATEILGAHVAAGLRDAVLTRTLGLPAPVLENAGAGDVTSRVTEDVENVAAAVPLITEVLVAVATVAVAAPGFLALDPRLAAAFLVVFPVYAVSLALYLPRAADRYGEERRRAAERGRVLLESLHGRETVAAYGMAALQTRRVEAASRSALAAGVRAMRSYIWFSKSMNAAEALGLSAILLAGYGLVHAGAVTVGAATAAALLFHRLFGPLGTLLLSFDDVQRAQAALARTVGVLLVPPAPPGSSRLPGGPVAITATGVRHAYGTGAEVLTGLDLVVEPGRSLALVGLSGAGKTTLANILAGVFPPSYGRVTLTDPHGPAAIGDLDAAVLRDWAALVSQEITVVAGTVRDDLTLALPGADESRIRAALDAVGLDLDPGASTVALGPAPSQKLALARIVLRDPPVVVLDEATAEAGSAGARDLDRAAAAAIRGRTAIVVAHRLSQARACDHIAVLDDGLVAELGTHDELLARDGHYARLWRAWEGAPLGPGPR